MIKIAPSILSANFARLGEEIKKAENAGADLMHVDVMDGHFVPNITIGPPVVKAIKKVTSIPLDVHLMIEKPDNYIEAFAKAGADIITIHAEASGHLHRSIQYIRNNKVKAGVSLNPSTPLNALDFILSEVDMVLLMSVNPGFSGQEFIPQTIGKIKALKDIIKKGKYKVEIEVDGGVNTDNASEVVKAGADILVMGNAFFNSKDYRDVIKTVRRKCK
ncbi:MAG: ribulose-phosphate 3-epimerase [Nitrospirae bacterium]|nr:ribulose-phosphate 3-epimerase [Nitrospirota bacterium]